MTAARLPAHVEVSALIRATEAAAGFATVIQKGDFDAGAILILTIEKGGIARLWERLPTLDDTRAFSVSKTQEIENAREFAEYLSRRTARDADCWLIELNVPNADRLIAALAR